MHDVHSRCKVAVAVAAAALDASPTPPAVDRLGYEAAELVLQIGVGGITFTTNNKVEFVVTHSDNNSDYSNVTDADMLGVTGISDGIIKALTAAHAAAAAYRFGYRGNKRYLKVLPKYSGSHASPTPLAASWVLSAGHVNPQANQA